MPFFSRKTYLFGALTLLASSVLATPIESSTTFDGLTFLPDHDPRIDRHALVHLQPSYSPSLFYRAAGANVHFLEFKMNYPAVVLENSAFAAYQCSPTDGTIFVAFSDAAIFETAKSWPRYGLAVVTNLPGCNPSDERGVYMTDNLVAYDDSFVVELQGRPVSWKDVAETMSIKFGEEKSESASVTPPRQSLVVQPVKRSTKAAPTPKPTPTLSCQQVRINHDHVLLLEG
jgi:hypothetical protein